MPSTLYPPPYIPSFLSFPFKMITILIRFELLFMRYGVLSPKQENVSELKSPNQIKSNTNLLSIWFDLIWIKNSLFEFDLVWFDLSNRSNRFDLWRALIIPTYFATLTREEGPDRIDRRWLFISPSNVTFMQDGAPSHTAKETVNLLKTKFRRIWSKDIWPGNSPDLNPIENLWAILQKSVFREPKPHDLSSLIERIQKTWSSFSIELTRNLVYSFTRRIRQCHERQGKSTEY